MIGMKMGSEGENDERERESQRDQKQRMKKKESWVQRTRWERLIEIENNDKKERFKKEN